MPPGGGATQRRPIRLRHCRQVFLMPVLWVELAPLPPVQVEPMTAPLID
jgi:hypothetical protein